MKINKITTETIGNVSLLLALVITMSFMTFVVARAELTEAEKQALEVEKKAIELAAEQAKQGGQTTTTIPTTIKVVTANLKGRISAKTANTVTVGIIGNGTVNIIANTSIKYNGKSSTFVGFIGDTITVKYDTANRNAIAIESQGYGFPAIYTGVAPVSYVGMIGNAWNNQHYGIIAGSTAINLNTSTQVTVNGVPSTYLDIKVGDIIDYVQDSTNAIGIFIKVTR